MPPSVQGFQDVLSKPVFFTNWTYNATPGSRAHLSSSATVLKNGYAVCFDATAEADNGTSTSDGVFRPHGVGSYGNVTKPATAILGGFAGIITGLNGDLTLQPGEGAWIKIQTHGEIDALTKADLALFDVLAVANDSWWLIKAANNPNSAAAFNTALTRAVGKSLRAVNTSSTAANSRVGLFPSAAMVA